MASTFTYMTQADLTAAISASHNIDPSIQNQIITQLTNDGFFPGSTVYVQQSTANSDVLVSGVQVFDTTATDVTVNTNTDPSLLTIISDVGAGTPVNLGVNGGENVLVALGNADYGVYLTGSGNDTVYAGSGTDSVQDAGSGNSKIYAGSGADKLMAGAGADSLYGGTGEDSLIGGNTSYLQSGSLVGGVNYLLSGSGALGKDSLVGGAGNDSLFGGAGADTLSAGTGDNVLYAGTGAHQDLVGGADTTAGHFQFIYDPGTGGSDTLSAGAGGGNHKIQGFGADSLYGGIGNDTLTGGNASYLQSGSGVGGVNQLFSGSGALGGDSLVGGAGNDILQGGAGADTLRAGSGDGTQVYAGSGANQDLIGGADIGAGQIQYLVDQGGGSDTLSAGSGGGAHKIVGFGADSLYGGTGEDSLIGGNTSYLQSGSGVGGVNYLLSQSGALGGDSLVGGAGNDELFGGAGADTLVAGSGNQLLYDGSASDSMKGGSGNDVFFVTGTTQKDTITAGTGSDTIAFLAQPQSGITYTPTGAPGTFDYTITFSDGQVIQDNGVQNLLFSDGTTKTLT